MSKKIFLFGILVGSALFGVATIALGGNGDSETGSVSIDYSLFSGTYGDKHAPKPGDVKADFVFGGTVANKVYGYLGPQSVNTACGTPDKIVRKRGRLSCERETATDKTRCGFGYNLVTGRPIAGPPC